MKGKNSMKKMVLFLSVIFFLFCQSSAFALLMSDSPDHDSARHNDFNANEGSVWQRLGQSSTADDGVLWRTSDLEAYANDAVTVGDTLTFQFEFWTAGWGRHSYDQLVAWADTDHLNGFEDDEMLLYEKRDKEQDAIQGPYDNTNADFTYYTATLFITDDMADGFWLRSRVHCVHDPDIRDNPTGYLSQGEVEDWFVEVEGYPVIDPVPVPGAFLLFGSGLIGLTGIFRRKK
jgi:hypothetical protein